ncbi:cobalamin biosynthesis protein [Maritalea sp.]|jgi:cobalt-precorrin 5A hydrolase/precorrin-3B C17-methyltransferase|uniref:cobalamin biosynthesis protein n=1 Tax=Maritalea sp. TaxID=2003361 RepID=UPI0039E305DE
MGQIKSPLVISFSIAGDIVARQVAEHLCAQLWLKSDAVGLDGKALIQSAFSADRSIIGVCAAGILIRFLAPLLADKQTEPPVIAISPNGEQVVPLLGGHHGANQLAIELSATLNANAAITTASDNVLNISLDEPPSGYIVSNPDLAKAAMAKLLAGEKIKLNGDAPWLIQSGLVNPDGTVKVVVSHLIQPDDVLHIVPKNIIVGIGCERHCPVEHVIELVEKALAENNISPLAIAAIASIDLKSDEAALNAAANHFNVPLRTFTAEQLKQEASRVPNPSTVVMSEVGTPSVAEASAIKAGKLLVEKQKTNKATCAIGISEMPIDVETFGTPAGALYLVGLGPGTNLLRTPVADMALRRTTDWVGYGLYLDLAADAKTEQTEHRFALGEEELRVRHALELAGEGKQVALICSGDANIFAMGALIYELLAATGDRAISDAAKRVMIETCPGISAFQAAAAKSGALIGHDFCCISLSDLLTPREDILKRLDAAAAGDFVTAFYNPRSMRRTDLIEIAKQKYLEHRPTNTPVVIASNLGRPAEKVRVVTLEDFNPEEIDMLTIVMFGSSQSKSFTRGSGETVAYTPRGYAKKAAKMDQAS